MAYPVRHANAKCGHHPLIENKGLSVNIRPFHLALPSAKLDETQTFYCQTLGCTLGRTSSEWIDLNLFGHQLVFHVTGSGPLPESHNPVDAHSVPIPHFGVVLTPDQHRELCRRITGKVEMIIEPSVRFEGTPGEQRTVFFRDPNGYALEFKSFANDNDLFAPF